MSEEAHSSLVGGSTADMRISCPASYQEEQKLPPSTKRESSVYADEGTALHECMNYILFNNVTDLDEVLGMTFGISETSPAGFVMTTELMETAIVPCVDFFDALCDELEEEGGFEFVVENRVEMPGIPGAFGTADILGRTSKRSICVDWKFGVGVRVKASYEDPEHKLGRRPNRQQSYYCRAGMHTFPHLFETAKDWPVQFYIVQPRSREVDEETEIFTECMTSVGELEEFRMELIKAVAEAKGPSPRMAMGPHCRFASCKAVCPLHLGPKMDIMKLQGALDNRRKGEEVEKIDWSTTFAWLLDAADIAETAIGEIRTQAHAFLEQGGKIVYEDGTPAYKLVDKKAVYKYTDQDGAKRHAIGLGLDVEDVFEPPTVKSPAQLRDTIAEKLMKGGTKAERKEQAVAELKPFAHSVSSGTTLAPAVDKRIAAIVTSDQLNELGAKIKALTGR